MGKLESENLAQCIKAYEKVGHKYLQTGLIKSQAKDFFFKSILCYMTNTDITGAKKCMETASFEDPSFDGSKQYKFLMQIMEACEGKDAGLFSKSV